MFGYININQKELIGRRQKSISGILLRALPDNSKSNCGTKGQMLLTVMI